MAKFLYWVAVIIGAVFLIMSKYIVMFVHDRKNHVKDPDYEPPARYRLIVMAIGALVLILGTLCYHQALVG